MRTRPGTRLDAPGRRSRFLALCLAAVAAALLAAVEPGELPLRFRACPFLWLTGLPCPFCGLTRAIHHVLRLDWAMAWYLNPLAFPAGALLLGLVARTALEVAAGRRLPPPPALRSRWLIALAVLLVLHWILHVRGAVAKPKPELLRSWATAAGWGDIATAGTFPFSLSLATAPDRLRPSNARH